MKEGWDRASSKGRELSTLFRETYDGIHKKLRPDATEYLKLTRKNRSKVGIGECLGEFREKLTTWMRWLETFNAVTQEALALVCSRDCEEDMLQQMEERAERLHKLRES